MKITVRQSPALHYKTPCLVLGVFQGKTREPLLQEADQALGGAFRRAVSSGEFSGRRGQSLLLYGSGESPAQRLLFVGLGKPGAVTLEHLRQSASEAGQLLAGRRVTRFALAFAPLRLRGTTAAAQFQALAEGALLAAYRYDRYRPQDDPGRPATLTEVTLLLTPESSLPEARQAVAAARGICSGVAFARDLVNTPGNVKSPEFLARQAVAMAEREGLRARLLDRGQLQREGFGALLGVAQGSQREPYLIVLEHRGGPAGERPLALIGKGVVFDSGGISLKPAEKMDEMKMDMGGAAAVLGTMQAAARLHLPLNLVAVIPAVENMPSGTAIRPGDILTSLSGKTIEVLNTDAEGRLILADALTYVNRFAPRVTIDLATLTGACIIALGHQAAAVLGTHQGLIDDLLKAGRASGEKLWQLPLWDDYAELMKSDFADLKNAGGRAAGTITAAAFLQQFAGQQTWAHLDIAGTAWEDKGRPGAPKGGTGFGVRVLTAYLRAQCS